VLVDEVSRTAMQQLRGLTSVAALLLVAHVLKMTESIHLGDLFQEVQQLSAEPSPSPPHLGDAAANEPATVDSPSAAPPPKKAPLPPPPTTIEAPAPAPPAGNDEYSAQQDWHYKSRQNDRQRQENNPNAAKDNGATDQNQRFQAAGQSSGPPPQLPASNDAARFVSKHEPTETPVDPDQAPRPDPASVQAWTAATGRSYTGSRDEPPGTMVPSDGRVNKVIGVDPTNKHDPYIRVREPAYPSAPASGSAMQAYIWKTSTAHSGDVARPVYSGMPSPTDPIDSDVKLPGSNGLAHFSPTFKDVNGRESASEPIVLPGRPGMGQYVVPPSKPDEPEPAAPAVPASVIKNITTKAETWLKENLQDVSGNEMIIKHQAKGPGVHGHDKKDEMIKSSKTWRIETARHYEKERLEKYSAGKLVEARTARERSKKKSLISQLETMTQRERDVKTRVTATERAAKVISQQKTAELTTKERAKKPSEAKQKTIDRAAGSARTAEAEEKYKAYDIVVAAAHKAEEKREEEELKERTQKQQELKKNAADKNVTLAEAMNDQKRQFLDILAKDAYVASMRSPGKAGTVEKNVAVKLEQQSQSIPELRPSALASTGTGGVVLLQEGTRFPEQNVRHQSPASHARHLPLEDRDVVTQIDMESDFDNYLIKEELLAEEHIE